jgi:hypothetical protein
MGNTTKQVLIGVGIAGVVIYFSIALGVGTIIHAARVATRARNQAATIQNMKNIVAVETLYSTNHGGRFATFQQLVSEQLLSQKFAGDPVAMDGYVLTLTLMPCTRELPSSYELAADPPNRNDPSNHFYVDSVSGQIHISPDKPARRDDPLLEARRE